MPDVLRRGFEEAWTQVTTFVPKLFAFAVILLIGWLVAKALAKGAELVLTRTGFPRLLERAGLGAVLTRARVDIAGLIVRLVFYFVMLIALQLAFGVFGTTNAVSLLLNDIVGYLPRVVVAILLVVIAAAIARAVRDVVVAVLGGRMFAPLIGAIAYWFILGLGIIAALSQLGIATSVTLPVLITVLATIGGILVVGVGGGLVRPMQERWQRWLGNLEDQTRGGTRS
ncbi:MAG: mechanosensitive ion channel family protein [Pseudonocardiaceae bacterium]